MSIRKTLTKRLLHCFKTTSPLQATVAPPFASKINFHSDYGNRGVFRRFSHRRPVYCHQGSTILPELLSFPVGEKLREKLKGINDVNLNKNSSPLEEATCNNMNSVITVKDARKILRAWQIEKIKAKLKGITENSISYSQFVRICVQVCESEHEGIEIAKIFDDSGCVIVTGNVVFLRPEQVAQALECLIFESITHPIEPKREKLKQMEKKKALIDEKAKAHVRGELYCGLGYLMVQTIGFMRLTFWELSWDVMEPICFFVTSLHFGLAYIFFLRTSTEPTFQGYFHARFKSKQQKLMKRYNFDIQQYNELCKVNMTTGVPRKRFLELCGHN